MISDIEEEALRDFIDIVDKIQIKFIVVGASARLLIFNLKHNILPSRTTSDWDIAVYISDWATFEILSNALIEGGNPKFEKDRLFHRFRHKNRTSIDIIPFGGVEREDGKIEWPQDKQLMNVSGFQEVFYNAEIFSLNDSLKISVASVPGLVVLKFFAFDGRNTLTERDLEDLYHILEKYDQAGNEVRIFDELFDLLSEGELNYESAGAYLLGVDVCRIISQNTLQGIISIIDKFHLTEPTSPHIYSLINRLGREHEIEAELIQISTLFEAFQAGLTVSVFSP